MHACGNYLITTSFLSPVVSPATIVGSAGQQTSAFILTLTLPRISYSQSELFIVSTLTPADSAPIVNDFPLSSQYSVIFSGLSAGVEYSYSIRIVLRTNTSVDVSIPLMGSFTLCKQCCAVVFEMIVFLTKTLSRCMNSEHSTSLHIVY